MNELRPRLASLSPLTLPDALWELLETSYATPPRAYHGFGHLVEAAQWFDAIMRGPGWTQPREVFVALLFHDAVYEAGHADNEARSAAMARDAVSTFGLDVDAQRIAHLIELTAQHGKLAGTLDDDEACFLDCDMSIVGSEPRRYSLYERQIADEYVSLAPEVYAAGRRAFLGRLYESRIFHSEPFFRTLEWRAKANLARALGLAVVVQAGTTTLRERAVELDPATIGSASNQALFRRMVDAMRAAPGVGLAAPQLGIGLRVFVLEDRPEYIANASELERTERERVAVPARVFVNPVLTPIGDKKVGFFEGCLSVEGYSGWVERFHEVEVEGLDEHGAPQTMRATGWPARILQHEFDHLEGMLYIDRMVTRSFASTQLAHERYAGKSAAEVRGLLGML
ncbi:MAG: peptide deformylase [Polyangia bacterium]